jgi:hypothetical protein
MTVYYVNIDLVVPLSTLLDDDSKRNHSKPGNNLKHQRPPSTFSNNSTTLDKKKTTATAPPWNIKLRSRLCSLVFGQATLHFKIGQRVQILNRPVFTAGTILYVGKLTSSADSTEKMVISKKIISVNHDLFLGVELDRSGKCYI